MFGSIVQYTVQVYKSGSLFAQVGEPIAHLVLHLAFFTA